MSTNNHPPLSTKSLEQDPGAFPLPFKVGGVELGSRLDSISPTIRYWAVNPKRAHAPWYNDMCEAHRLYEEWLQTQPPGEYPIPFGGEHEGKRLGDVPDRLRYWAVNPDRSSAPWYENFVKANTRYEARPAETRQPGDFPFPPGIRQKYTGRPIKDIPQDCVWWALRPANRAQGWYQPLYDANKRMLDERYQSRSPGSELIRFRHRLDRVCERKHYMRWCFDPKRKRSGWIYRLEDLVERLEAWQRMHPHQRKGASDTQNPVGEVLIRRDDVLASVEEEDDEIPSSVQLDGEALESDMDTGGSDVGTLLPHKRKLSNVMSDEEPEPDMGDATVPGKRSKVQDENAEE